MRRQSEEPQPLNQKKRGGIFIQTTMKTLLQF
jgi:hypothetical protein